MESERTGVRWKPDVEHWSRAGRFQGPWTFSGSFMPDKLLKPLSWAAGSKQMYVSISQDGQDFGSHITLEPPCYGCSLLAPSSSSQHGPETIPGSSICLETRAGLRGLFQCPKSGVSEPSSSVWSLEWERNLGLTKSCICSWVSPELKPESGKPETVVVCQEGSSKLSKAIILCNIFERLRCIFHHWIGEWQSHFLLPIALEYYPSPEQNSLPC